MRESTVEMNICNIVKARGGYAWKWVSPGRRGVPDRICLFPGAKVIFVELKRPGLTDGRSAQQKKVFSILKALGFQVWRIDSAEDFIMKLSEVGL